VAGAYCDLCVSLAEHRAIHMKFEHAHMDYRARQVTKMHRILYSTAHPSPHGHPRPHVGPTRAVVRAPRAPTYSLSSPRDDQNTLTAAQARVGMLGDPDPAAHERRSQLFLHVRPDAAH